MPPSTTRRSFLQTGALSGVGFAAATTLTSVQAAFADAVASTHVPGDRASSSLDDEFTEYRKQYMLADGLNYLNHASIGTIPKLVHQARQRYLEICESNPWLYMWSGEWDDQLRATREKAAAVMGCGASEVAITHNTTEMFNTLAHGLPLGNGDEVLFSTLCHVGASQAFLHFANDRGYSVRRFEFPVDKMPSISADDVLEAYVQQITPATKLLILSHIDNTLGIRYPLRAIADRAREKGVEFIAVDAAQSVGMIPVDVSRLNVDVFSTSPHKWLQAPKGLGLAYVRDGLYDTLQPMWVTWGQRRWRDSARKYEDYGTRNLAEAVSLGDAIDFNTRMGAEKRDARLRDLWAYAQQAVENNSKLRWVSPDQWEMAASLYAIEAIGKPADRLAETLFNDHAIVVRPFRTLGLNTLRVSPNVFTTRGDLDAFLAVISG